MNNNNRVFLCSIACLLSITTSAFAWNPNEGAEDVSKPAAKYTPVPSKSVAKPTPALVAPTSVTATAPTYAAPAYTPAPVYTAPALTPPPAPVPAAPIVAAAPLYTAPAPAYTPVPVPPPTYTPAPAYAPIAAAPATGSYTDTSSAPAYRYGRKNRFAVGFEAFHDRYQEPRFDIDVDSRAIYGSIDAEAVHYFNPRWFGEVDARASYGKEHYHSISGNIDGVDQWEGEFRTLVGTDIDYLRGRHFKPYIGLGVRHYRDEGKDEVTDTGFFGYERRITQVYMPVGLGYEFKAYGLQMAPKVEFDPVLYGYVQSRLQTIPGYSEAENNQHSGYGWRGEFLVGDINEEGNGWQFGPFVRYWNMRDSDINEIQTPGGPSSGLEPENTRVQLGMTLKLLF